MYALEIAQSCHILVIREVVVRMPFQGNLLMFAFLFVFVLLSLCASSFACKLLVDTRIEIGNSSVWRVNMIHGEMNFQAKKALVPD